MNEVELLFHQVRLGESSKKTLEKLAQECWINIMKFILVINYS